MSAKTDRVDKMALLRRSHSFWLHSAFNDIDGIIDMARIALESVEYDTMVGTGLSGGLVIPILSKEFSTYFAIIRKEYSSHTNQLFQGNIGQRWIFVDDFVNTGATRNKVTDAVSDFCPETVFVGTYEYEHRSGRFTYA